MADTTGVRDAYGKMLGLSVEIWHGTTPSDCGTQDTVCVCATGMSKILHVSLGWAEDIGATAIILDYQLNTVANPGAGVISLQTNADLAKNFTMLVVGYP